MIKKPEKKEFKIPSHVISQAEFNRRKMDWMEYYAKVKGTKAYQRYLNQQEAVKNKDWTLVKQLAKEGKEVLHDQTQEIVMPYNPDPEVEIQYDRLGVQEWIEATLKESDKKTFQERLIFETS
jgi:hypothetical protein